MSNKKRLHLICNAHLDPVWQWEWEEGAAEALSTFRIAEKFCRDFDGFVFNHNEALLFRWVNEYEPELFERIKERVKDGSWHIMSGWHIQPDCNMPSGEAFVRQIKFGRDYFKKHFGVSPTTAINFDPFGHTRGLVQILKKSGYDSYIFMRPKDAFLELPAELFRWVGYDGSEVLAQRSPNYNTRLGQAYIRIQNTAKEMSDNIGMVLWGVGNHGGGPSKEDLENIDRIKKEFEEKDVEIIHSTPEKYFSEVKEMADNLPTFAGELNLWAPGCYTSMALVKKKYRAIENSFFMTERMVTAAESQGLMKWPQEEFEQAYYDMLTVQFHDMLPGTVVQPAEDMTIRMLDHGLEVLSRIKARAFYALSHGQIPAKENEIPILIYNPYPYPIEGDFECEMSLWDQNWAEEFSVPQVVKDGEAVATQFEKENSSINLDWRKRVVFHTTLEPMQMNRYDCRFIKVPKKPEPICKTEDENFFYLINPDVVAKISKKSGYLVSYSVKGKELLGAEGLKLHIVEDSCDPWAMYVTSFPDIIDEFKLLSDKDAAIFSGIKNVIPAVRCIENGDVRTVIEAILGYGHSRAVIHYTLSHFSDEIKVDVRIQWAENQKMVKLGIPTSINNSKCVAQVAYGEEEYKTEVRENVMQKYVAMKNDNVALSVSGDSTYGFSYEGNDMYLTLLRSPSYCAHPIQEREVLEQNRFNIHMEQGERTFSFVILGGDETFVSENTPRMAMLLNEKPMSLSFYPSKDNIVTCCPLKVIGDKVEVTVFKKADDERGYILRIFNPFGNKSKVNIRSELLNVDGDVELSPYEIKTLRIFDSVITENNLLEE